MNHLASLRGNPQGTSSESRRPRWSRADTAVLVWASIVSAKAARKHPRPVMNVGDRIVSFLSQKDIYKFGILESWRGADQKEVLVSGKQDVQDREGVEERGKLEQ